ncbi:MAG TPA: hemerythrin family protein [Clostridiaceae bacterium]|nr:hemerythrin family protein [Clostridiaceae bacterium]
MFFKWRDTFKLDIPEIDEQHKKLFEMGSRLYEIISLKDNYDHYDEIMQIIDELRNYAKYHFSYEEELMRKKNYENYEEHKIEHDFFIKKIARINVADIEEEQEKVMLEMATFIADWISGHILKTDKNYREILK